MMVGNLSLSFSSVSLPTWVSFSGSMSLDDDKDCPQQLPLMLVSYLVVRVSLITLVGRKKAVFFISTKTLKKLLLSGLDCLNQSL